MTQRPDHGFTLIELLTVIAIIAILASLTSVAVPHALEKAKLTRNRSVLHEIRTAQTDYFAKNSTYVPGYGFRTWESRGKTPSTMPSGTSFYHLLPYTAELGIHNVEKMYDEFSEGFHYDTDRSGGISLMEFIPRGDKNLATGVYTFPTERYDGSNLKDETDQMDNAPIRPFVYAPVNLRQFKQAKRYWIESGDYLATTWNPDPGNALSTITFPPENYDAFALVGMGPGGSTFGLAAGPPSGNYDPEDVYHIAALRTYYLATRDLNDNNLLDFEFEARTRQKEGSAQYTVGGTAADNTLPDPLLPAGQGPILYSVP